MNNIYHISIGKRLETMNLSFSRNENSNCQYIIKDNHEIKNIIEMNMSDDVQTIHFIIEDEIELYILISYYFRLLYPNIKLVCIVCSKNILIEDLEYFNHLSENNDYIILEDINLQNQLYDQLVIFEDINDYRILEENLESFSSHIEFIKKHYPTPVEIEKYIQSYIKQNLDNSMNNIDENEVDDFINYFGIDQNHLRNNLHNEHIISNISLQEYVWNDVFGKNPKINIKQYLKMNTKRIVDYFENKQNDILIKVKQYLLNELKANGNSFYLYCLDDKNDKGLYQFIKKEKEIDLQYLNNINKKTYKDIKEKYSIAKSAHGLFSNKGEKLDDLFQSIDMFLSQRYEICRYEAMKYIYEETLEYLQSVRVNIDFIYTPIPLDMKEVLDSSQIFQLFIEKYIECGDIYCYREIINGEYIYTHLIEKTLNNYENYEIVISKYSLNNKGIVNEHILKHECYIGILYKQTYNQLKSTYSILKSQNI
jgi:hypothetical protein